MTGTSDIPGAPHTTPRPLPPPAPARRTLHTQASQSALPLTEQPTVDNPGGRAAGSSAEPLPPQLAEALDGFRRHLAAERGVSPHTVRAYLGDVGSLLEHAVRAGIGIPDELDIGVLRGWLAGQHATGHARATLARRAAAARTFTAFACARGWLGRDPGVLLGTPKTRRRLPEVLRQDQMAAVLAAAGRLRPAGGGPGAAVGAVGAASTAVAAAGSARGATLSRRDRAIVLRDSAIMELLYATGIRVSELCGLGLGR